MHNIVVVVKNTILYTSNLLINQALSVLTTKKDMVIMGHYGSVS